MAILTFACDKTFLGFMQRNNRKVDHVNLISIREYNKVVSASYNKIIFYRYMLSTPSRHGFYKLTPLRIVN